MNTVLTCLVSAIQKFDKEHVIECLWTSSFTKTEIVEATKILWNVADDESTLGAEQKLEEFNTRLYWCRMVVEGLIKLGRVFNLPNFVCSPAGFQQIRKSINFVHKNDK